MHEFHGLYVDYARMLADEAGLELVFEDVAWSELHTSFGAKKLDIVLSVFATTARSAYADFVAAFHQVGISAVAREGAAAPESARDLVRNEYRIAVSAGEAGESLVLNDLKIPRRRVVCVDSFDLDGVFSPLAAGKADLAVSDSWTCAEYTKNHSGMVHLFTDEALDLCKNSIMVPKGDPEYAQWIDDMFNAVRDRSEAREIEAATLELTDGWIRRFR